MSEMELINSIREGSLESFDQLMLNYQNHVYRIAHNFAKNSDGAMDITQNVFLKIYQKLDTFRGNSQFRTWITRIAYNEGQNWLKKNKKHFNVEQYDHMASPPPQEDEVLAHENKAALLSSLYTLNTKYRIAVVLRYFENYSIRDIAETLACSEGVVKNMLFRSLKKLKASLQIVDLGVKNVG